MTQMFITFEGLDGSGKSSHLMSVAAELERLSCEHIVTKEPGGTPLADAIRSVFLDPRWDSIDGGVELLLVFASRRQHLLERVDPALAAGQVVLCDRFTDSTYAYQGYGRGVGLDEIDAVDRLATGRRRPDRTLLFDLPAEEAWRRGQSGERRSLEFEHGGADRIDREGVEFYQRVRDGFLALAEAEPERYRVVDSSGSIEDTAIQVRQSLYDVFDSVTALSCERDLDVEQAERVRVHR